MSEVIPMDFANSLDREFEKKEAMPPRKLGAISDWFLDKIKKVLESSDLTGLSREDFLKAVASAYDKFVLPIDLPGPDAILDPLLKQVLLTYSGRAYDKFMEALA